MGRKYWVDLTPTAVTVAADLVELTPATNKPIRVLATNIGQTSDVGDAAEEIISLVWVRGNTTAGSGGSSVTPRPCDLSGAAAGFTAKGFNTTAASAGTPVNGPRHCWNERIGLERPYTESEIFEASAGNTLLVLRMAAAPADSITVSGSILVEELG